MGPTTRSMTAKASSPLSPLNTPSRLLGLPGGVENLVLSFVSSGNGGLRDTLNLRSVCTTTRSWVDNLPKRQADVVFSNAKVRITSRSNTVKSARGFLEFPPPFGVRSLSLESDGPYEELTKETKDLANRVYGFWSSRVESLTLRRLTLPFPIFPNSYSLEDHFFLRLEELPKLRNLSVSLSTLNDFTLVRKFIEFKKNEPRLRLHVTLNSDTRILHPLLFNVPPGDEDVSLEEFGSFVATVVSSNSNIRLQLDGGSRYFVRQLRNFIPHEITSEFFKLIVGIHCFEITEDFLNLGDIFPRLRNCSEMEVHAFDNDLQEGQLLQLTFPASLEELGFWGDWRLPPCDRLPPALRSLTFRRLACDARILLSSLAFLSERCASLETLNVCWDLKTTLEPLRDVEKSPGFPKLRSLTFMGALGKKANLSAGRLVLSSRFQWDKMELNYLVMHFSGYRGAQLPVVGAELLAKILEGPTAKTLLKIEMRNEAVTPEGLPLLQKLRLLAAENWKRREETEGRGKWTKHAFPQHVDYEAHLSSDLTLD